MLTFFLMVVVPMVPLMLVSTYLDVRREQLKEMNEALAVFRLRVLPKLVEVNGYKQQQRCGCFAAELDQLIARFAESRDPGSVPFPMSLVRPLPADLTLAEVLLFELELDELIFRHNLNLQLEDARSGQESAGSCSESGCVIAVPLPAQLQAEWQLLNYGRQWAYHFDGKRREFVDNIQKRRGLQSRAWWAKYFPWSPGSPCRHEMAGNNPVRLITERLRLSAGKPVNLWQAEMPESDRESLISELEASGWKVAESSTNWTIAASVQDLPTSHGLPVPPSTSLRPQAPMHSPYPVSGTLSQE